MENNEKSGKSVVISGCCQCPHRGTFTSSMSTESISYCKLYSEYLYKTAMESRDEIRPQISAEGYGLSIGEAEMIHIAAKIENRRFPSWCPLPDSDYGDFSHLQFPARCRFVNANGSEDKWGIRFIIE